MALVSGHGTGSYLFAEGSETTIASGVLAPAQSAIIVNGEGGVSDDLVTISPAVGATLAGYQMLLMLKAKTGLTITVKSGSGNITLASGADFSLTGEKTLMLFRMSASDNWNDISGSA